MSSQKMIGHNKKNAIFRAGEAVKYWAFAQGHIQYMVYFSIK